MLKDFLQSIRKYSIDRFKVIVKVIEFLRKQQDSLDRPDILVATLAQTDSRKTKTRNVSLKLSGYYRPIVIF